MDSLIGFYIYAAIFRLAIIAAGIVSIVLGYKLFVHNAGSENRTDVGAQADRFKIIVRNAAPGTVFAAFGAIIIAVMLSQGNPEIVLKDVETVMKDSQGNSQSEVHIGSALLKGRDDHKSGEELQRFDQAYNEGMQKKRAGDVEGAITAYNRALEESEVPLVKAADVLNELAWIYREQHRFDEALALVHIATTVDRNNANAFDTLALILLDQKELKAAEQAAEKAVELDPVKQDYKNTLQQVRAAQKAGQ
ncbi:MAG: hypothetical protein D3908_00290 [Candidatus Electrothrix sp. AUS4]|nr:hypothetical protein [Candidatus Electrothrix sp. AUS4]